MLSVVLYRKVTPKTDLYLSCEKAPTSRRPRLLHQGRSKQAQVQNTRGDWTKKMNGPELLYARPSPDLFERRAFGLFVSTRNATKGYYVRPPISRSPIGQKVVSRWVSEASEVTVRRFGSQLPLRFETDRVAWDPPLSRPPVVLFGEAVGRG